MLWVYIHYKYFISVSAVTLFRRQNLTSDGHRGQILSSKVDPTLKELKVKFSITTLNGPFFVNLRNAGNGKSAKAKKKKPGFYHVVWLPDGFDAWPGQLSTEERNCKCFLVSQLNLEPFLQWTVMSARYQITIKAYNAVLSWWTTNYLAINVINKKI